VVVNRAKEISRLPQILKRQLEEELLSGLAVLDSALDVVVVKVRVLDRVVEDRGI
jgi:hypothetical protein